MAVESHAIVLLNWRHKRKLDEHEQETRARGIDRGVKYQMTEPRIRAGGEGATSYELHVLFTQRKQPLG